MVLTAIMATPVLSQGSLKRQKVTKEISMKIPAAFIPMDIRQQRIKYVSDREPVAMYTTEDGNVDLGINMASTMWGSADLDILHDFYKAGILNLYDQVDFAQDTVRTINDRQYIVFEFNAYLTGEDNSFARQAGLSKYIYIQYTLREGSVLLFNFSAPARARQTWEAVASEMMNSVQIK